MMENHVQLVTVLSTLFSLALIWYLAMWLGRDYHVAFFRQSMLELRAELFDMAADKKISFDHPAYGLLRKTMNGLIHFGHRLSLFNIIVLVVFMRHKRRVKKTFAERWEETIRNVDAVTLAQLNDYKKRMDELIVRQLMVGSPLLMILILPSATAAVGLALCKGHILEALKEPIESIDNAALAVVEC